MSGLVYFSSSSENTLRFIERVGLPAIRIPLNERERIIFEERRLKDDPITLEELAERFGVSRERVRQIEVRAFEKLQNRMRVLARDKGMAIPA